MTTFADPFTRTFGAGSTAAVPQGRVGLPPETRTQIADQATALRALMRQQQQRQQQHQPKPQQQGGSPAQPRPVTPRVARRATVVAITSGKGGVGKSNVAVNLAIKLTAAGKRVVLLDADMGLANADVLCNLDLPANLSHVLSRKKDLKDVMTKAPGGFQLIGGASGLAKLADLSDADRRRLTDALTEIEHLADVILIDTGAGLSPNVLSFTRAADHVLVVTTPEPTAITDAYALIKTIAKRDPADGPQRVSLLVNQTRSPADAKAVVDRITKVAKQFLNLDIFDAGSVPEDDQLRAAVRRRSPVLISAPKCPAALAIAQLATRLEQGVPPVQGSGFFTKVNRWFRK